MSHEWVAYAQALLKVPYVQKIDIVPPVLPFPELPCGAARIENHIWFGRFIHGVAWVPSFGPVLTWLLCSALRITTNGERIPARFAESAM